MLDILNKAIHVTKYDVKQKLALHTGITFEIHTETKFKLLYELWENDLIFQTCDYVSLPRLAGLFTFSKNKPFFESYFTEKMVDKIRNDDSAFSELKINQGDIDYNRLKHKFEIIDTQDNVLQSFPLQMELPFVIYNGREEFKIWDPNDNDYCD